MTLTGDMLIGSSSVPASDGTMKALNPATGQQIEPDFALGGPAEVDRAARLADEAFDSYNRTGLKERAAFLELIADRLDGINGELAERAALETGLPVAQLKAEAIKTAVQFRQFAEVVSQGRFRHATVDPAQPERPPRPRMVVDHPLIKAPEQDRLRLQRGRHSPIDRRQSHASEDGSPRHRVGARRLPGLPRR
jgi:2,5-dioxopentanoate dehydrogenase